MRTVLLPLHSTHTPLIVEAVNDDVSIELYLVLSVSTTHSAHMLQQTHHNAVTLYNLVFRYLIHVSLYESVCICCATTRQQMIVLYKRFCNSSPFSYSLYRSGVAIRVLVYKVHLIAVSASCCCCERFYTHVPYIAHKTWPTIVLLLLLLRC
jgi:hypothetical protein